MVLIVGLLLFWSGLLLYWLATRVQRATGLPRVPIQYDDASQRWVEKPLVSHRYQLTGRPDYIVEENGYLVPVEIKPQRRARKPYQSDVMQLAAYCLLVEEEMGQAPPYGILAYAEARWRIPYDAPTRAQLLTTLRKMNLAGPSRALTRDHRSPQRCAGCSQRTACSERL